MEEKQEKEEGEEEKIKRGVGKGETKGIRVSSTWSEKTPDLRGLFSEVHALTSRRRGVIKHSSEWLGHPNEYK